MITKDRINQEMADLRLRLLEQRATSREVALCNIPKMEFPHKLSNTDYYAAFDILLEAASPRAIMEAAQALREESTLTRNTHYRQDRWVLYAGKSMCDTVCCVYGHALLAQGIDPLISAGMMFTPAAEWQWDKYIDQPGGREALNLMYSPNYSEMLECLEDLEAVLGHTKERTT